MKFEIVLFSLIRLALVRVFKFVDFRIALKICLPLLVGFDGQIDDLVVQRVIAIELNVRRLPR